MADAGQHGGATGGRTRHARFTNYRAAEVAALVAALNAHVDVALRRRAGAGSPYFAVVGLHGGGDGADVVVGAGGVGDDGFVAMLRSLEGAASAHGVVCRNRGVGVPSLDRLDLGNAVLRRGDIAGRGLVVHRMLSVLCGERGVFVLGRGNPYVVGALYAPDPEAVYDALCRSTGAGDGDGQPRGNDADGAGCGRSGGCSDGEA